MIAGEPTEEQTALYEQWMTVRNWIADRLVPGEPVNQIYKKVVEQAKLAGIPLMTNVPLGHGVGVKPEEPPFITARDDTILQINMTLVVCPVIHPENDSYMWMKDTFVITKTGSRLVGWYKDWREPYIPIASI
jgi:Xaa-Pro aminopeptidase